MGAKTQVPTIASAAERRGHDPQDLRRAISGDLDWIVMKAIAKERERRYGSVAELAADLERHLRLEPVIAHPPDLPYMARRFVRRHRVSVLAAVLVVLSLALLITMPAREMMPSSVMKPK